MSTGTTNNTDRIIARFARKRRNHWSPANIAHAVRVLTRVQGYLAERQLDLLDDDVNDLSDALDDYLADRLALGLAPSTVLVDHRQLAAFYKWAAASHDDDDRLIRRNPMRDVAAPRQVDTDPARTPVATRADYDALMATCRGRKTRDGTKPVNDCRDAAVIALLWHTGMRRCEAAGIDFENIDFDMQSVHLARTKGRRAAKSRNVYIPDEVMDLIDRYLDGRGTQPGPLFESTRGGGRMRADSITRMLNRRGRIAGVHAPAHSFRRGAAVTWIEAGGSETTLMRNHGWSSRKMVDVYTGPSADELTFAEARRIAAARRSGGHLRVVN